ncbi:MAG: recombination mediator RecR [Patescibacteria group bacterium]
MRIPKAIKALTEAFERLPGIGPKTAQRLTFYLLHVPQDELEMLSSAVAGLKAQTKVCKICKNVGEDDPCEVCTDDFRDKSVIAVVESPLDVMALERTGFKGLYHVLHGVISPLNNIGPDDVYINELISRLKKANESLYGGVGELILATNTNMEGESTSLYISKLVNDAKEEVGEIKITRIARGLPVGGDIEYADDITLRRALEGRHEF